MILCTHVNEMKRIFININSTVEPLKKIIDCIYNFLLVLIPLRNCSENSINGNLEYSQIIPLNTINTSIKQNN